MTEAEYEARIDRIHRELLAAETRDLRVALGCAYLAAIDARNSNRTPEQVAQIERKRGLRS